MTQTVVQIANAAHAKPRRILIASANPWSFAVAVERDIIRAHPHAEVDLLNLYRGVASRSPHFRVIDRVLLALDRPIERFVAPAINGRDVTPDIQFDLSSIPPVPSAPSELRGYKIGGAAVGLAVLSSITSITMVQEPASTSEYGDCLLPAWRSAHLSYQAGEAVARMGYDAVYIFNGRHCYSRPFIDVIERTATVYRYEQGAAGDSYVMSDTSIHHPLSVAKLISDHDFDPEEGAKFYEDRFKRAPGDAVNLFTRDQQIGHLPGEIKGREIVSFFTSSSDEMFAITDDVGFGAFPTQFSAAMAMARVCRERSTQLVVRFHPHLKYKHESWQREWDFDALRSAGAFLLMPDDPCDSYALARASRCVFTCGSTVGFECSFLGVPNADLGLWVGGVMGAMPAVLDETSLEAFVSRPYLLPTARLEALRYGSYVRRAGTKLAELEVGTHPYFARIGGRIVAPSRFSLQRVRSVLSSMRSLGGARMTGMVNGKVVLDPSLSLKIDNVR